MITLYFIAFILFSRYIQSSILDGLLLCQKNCLSSDRLTGPTKMEHTRQHPWKITQFPSKYTAFCKLGCQLFFSELPTNVTCKTACDYYYRYKVTVGYSDVIHEAQLECRDGCDIGLQVCQAGYYCVGGEMNPCLPGTFREPIPDISEFSLDLAHKCIDCPYGRYRSMSKGKSADDCSLCPIGKYANTTGNTAESQCLRCPAGKFSAEEGARLCKCITPDSCDLEVSIGQGEKTYFSGNESIDFFRETVPYVGRW